jgi:sterol desaturase/sphingolipid hydroxylase (fatty acid hydroxylase superfamily)
MDIVRRAAAWLIFPLVLGAALVWGFYSVAIGEPQRALFAVPVSFVLLLFLERASPHLEAWQRSHRDVWVDIGLGLTAGLFRGLIEPLLLSAGFFVLALYAPASGSGLWPGHWPLWAQLGLAAVLGEFTHYWAHRLAHEHASLWRFHAVHHSAPRLYWLNALRFHPVDLIWLSLGQIVVLAALGVSSDALLMMGVLTGVHGVLQHSNVRLDCTGTNWVFSAPDLHRWHHSRIAEEANANYGNNLVLWDIAFGTRKLPAGQPPADIGVAEPANFPTTYWAQILAPFRWKTIR